jgi:hypothetical protein
MVGAFILARRYRHKIRVASRQFPIIDDPALSGAIKKRFNGYSFDLWHKVYAAASGRPSVDYLPEDIFYNVFENRLNPRHRKASYGDKNHYDRLGWSCLPETVFRIINGRLFDASYHMIDLDAALLLAQAAGLSEFVAKPARATGGGVGVRFLDPGQLASFAAAQNKPNADWIFQHPIRQHADLARLHPNCVNTLRIITIRMERVATVVSAFLRIGTGTARIDNLTAGKGIAVGVEKDGRLSNYGYDNDLRRSEAHPDHGYAFEGLIVPSFQAAQQSCIRLHETIPELDFISWDVAIAYDGAPVVLEFNIRRQDIIMSQVCSGPVLKPYIDEVLGWERWLIVPGIGAIDRHVDIR